jgi:hypothetical protein
MKAIRWRADLSWLFVICLLSLTNFPMLESIYLQQPGMLAAALLAATCAAIVSGRMVLSGVLLGCSTIKPQLSLLLAAWMLFWALTDWPHRKRVVLSFAATLFILIFASELVLPGWLSEFIWGLIAYQRYNAVSSILDMVFGRFIGVAVALILLGFLSHVAWRTRSAVPHSELFGLTFAAVLACTVVIMPTVYPTAQIVVVPGIFIIIKLSRLIWSKSRLIRLQFLATMILLFWPYFGAALLFFRHLTVPVERVGDAWIIVLAPILLVPTMSLILLLLLLKSAVNSQNAPYSKTELLQAIFETY